MKPKKAVAQKPRRFFLIALPLTIFFAGFIAGVSYNPNKRAFSFWPDKSRGFEFRSGALETSNALEIYVAPATEDGTTNWFLVYRLKKR